MAKVIYKYYNPNDSLLLPPCLGDYLPENHPSRVVSAVIDRLDISAVESGYAGGGTSSYNPRMLLKVIVYSYLNNVYSGYILSLEGMSRKRESLHLILRNRSRTE